MYTLRAMTQLEMDYLEQARFETTEFFGLKFLGQDLYNTLIKLGTLLYQDNEFTLFADNFRLGILADENGIKDIAVHKIYYGQ